MRRSTLLSILLLLCFAGTAQAAAPGAIFTCGFTGQLERVDPIVSPGVTPSAHFHRFAGAGPVTSTSDSNDLRSKPTSCVETGNHSGYWIISPVQDGQHLGPYGTANKAFLAYYRCKHSASVCATMPSFPDNFGHVVGNANASSEADNPLFQNLAFNGYRCTTGGGAFSAAPPACPVGPLVVSVTFGNCRFFDGHTSMQLNSACTGAGGIPMPRIEMYWRFRLLNPINAMHPVTLDGHPTYQLHADVLFAWEQTNFENFMNRCIRANVDCGTNPDV